MKPIQTIILMCAITVNASGLLAATQSKFESKSMGVKTKTPISLSALYLNVAYNKLPSAYATCFNASFMLNTGWGGSMGEKHFNLGSKNKPADYDGGFILFFTVNNPPSDRVSSLYFTVNKSIQHKSKRIRVGIEVGPSIINYSETFYSEKKKVDPNFMTRDANYDYYQKDYSCLGFYSKLKVEIPVFRYFGIQCSAFSDRNRYSNMQGLEIGAIIGLVRDKR